MRKHWSWLLCCAGILLLAASGCSGENASRIVTADNVEISEIMSVNNYYAPLPDGSCCDWVEIHNTSQEPVNLKGCMLSDDAKANKWKVPADWILEPDGYGVIYLSEQNTVDEAGNLHTNFKLSSKGETLLFSNASGEMIQQITIPACTLANVSYGTAEGTDSFVWYAEPSPGRANAGHTAENLEDLEIPDYELVINEYMTKNTYVICDGNGEYSDWIEIYNASDHEMNLSGCALSDSEDGQGRWYFPEGAAIGAKEYLVVFCTDTVSNVAGVYHADFRLSAGDTITLYSITGAVSDSVKAVELNPNVSCGRDQSSGEWRQFSSPTPGRANNTYSYALTSKVGADPYSPLYVSEVLCVSDNEGTYNRDFIEIHNALPQAAALKGFSLSKGKDGEKYVFPDVTVKADGYQVVYCTGKLSNTPDHLTAPFKLDQGGEDIFLYDNEGHTIDCFATGPQTYGHSSGRISSKKNRIYVFGEPSPGRSNDDGTAYTGYAPAPVFSSDGGYVEKGFILHMQIPENCTVYYTTDGNVPNKASLRYQENAPVVIQHNTVVCAVAYQKGCLPSRMVYATFLVDASHTIPVVSVSSPPDGLFSNKSGILSNAVGQLMPDQANYMSEEKRDATFEYFINGQKAVSFRGGLKVAGDYSRTFPQKGLAVIMSEIYGGNACYFPFFGSHSPQKMEALLLRPSGQDWLRSHLRDEFCSRILRDSTVQCDYQEAQPVALYLNGEYWGLYYIREKLNEDYLVNKYGYTKGKIDIIKWEGSVQSGSGKDWNELLKFCEANSLREEKNYRYVCSQVDIDSLIDWWIFETYAANDDTGNVRCCRDQNGGKWHWMLFDLDDAFHLSYYRVNYIKKYAMGSTHGLAGCRNTLIRRLLMNEDFRDRFITAYLRHLDTTFAPERLETILDQLQAEIDPEMDRQCARWEKPSRDFYEYNIDAIRRIIKAKPAIARRQIQESFGLSDKEMQVYSDAAAQLP